MIEGRIKLIEGRVFVIEDNVTGDEPSPYFRNKKNEWRKAESKRRCLELACMEYFGDQSNRLHYYRVKDYP